MALPRITSPEPVVEAAKSEKSYSDWYSRSLTINAPFDAVDQCSAVMQPYNYDTKEIGDPSSSMRIEIDGLKSLAAQRAADGKPALAQALGAVLVAVTEMINEPDIWASRKNNVIEIKA